MCGICGVIQLGGPPRRVVPDAVLDSMTDAMTHRGPDDRGTYSAPGAALGVRRLSIVDVSGGHQPLANETGSIVAVQNGELYNHETIRRTLERDGHAFRTRCDTEILPHLYERDRERYSETVRGKFAIAVWDSENRRAVLARDRLGVKPLYHGVAGDLLVFASELKSLLASGLIEPALDYEAIDAYLTLGFLPGPRTPLATVQKLDPGHRLIADANGVRIEPYWEYPLPMPVERSLDEHVAGLLEGLRESVRLRLMSDVPLGAMLSGGLDSSLVVALMASEMTEPVKTFSIGFSDADGTDELGDAREVAALFGADHHEIELSLDDDVDLAELAWVLDEPLADLSALGMLALSELAARHVKVALSGQGADELLGGYSRHRNAARAAVLARLPRSLRATIAALAARGPRRARKAVGVVGAPDAATRMLAIKGNLGPADRAGLFRGPLAVGGGEAALKAIRRHTGGLDGDLLASTLFLDAKLGLVDDMLHYFDRTSMARSLEVRVPFLDHRLVEFCATIPASLKVRGSTTKYVLKEAARGLLPDRIVDKPKQGFFNAAVDSWFRAQAAGAVADYVLDPGARYTAILERSVVEGLVAEHAAGGAGANADLLLAILMLEVWLATYLPRATAASTAPEQIYISA
jgi:asparagine synthase (glutamine-hydrolysing)